jgi:hypothetical protein
MLSARPEGKRGTGRPKMRWLDDLDQEQGKGTGEDRLETEMNGKSFQGRPGPTWGY